MVVLSSRSFGGNSNVCEVSGRTVIQVSKVGTGVCVCVCMCDWV